VIVVVGDDGLGTGLGLLAPEIPLAQGMVGRESVVVEAHTE
jgi:hypothetical protein